MKNNPAWCQGLRMMGKTGFALTGLRKLQDFIFPHFSFFFFKVCACLFRWFRGNLGNFGSKEDKDR